MACQDKILLFPSKDLQCFIFKQWLGSFFELVPALVLLICRKATVYISIVDKFAIAKAYPLLLSVHECNLFTEHVDMCFVKLRLGNQYQLG